MSQELDKRKAYMHSYNSRPDVVDKRKAYEKEYNKRPEVKERKRRRSKEYLQRPEVKIRRNAWTREYRKNPEVKVKKIANQKNYRQRKEVKERRAIQQRGFYMRNMAGHKKSVKNYQVRNRLSVLKYYSKGTMACACCGENHLEFLAIDHINGKKHPEILKLNFKHGSGCGFYRDLIKASFPDGFQVLCHNCNVSKGMYGSCPHRRELNVV